MYIDKYITKKFILKNIENKNFKHINININETNPSI